jgi:outer membrane immunogenic protein
MTRKLGVPAVLAGTLLSGAALAADIPSPVYKARPAAAVVYDWTGFYVGANWGTAIGQSRASTPGGILGSAEVNDVGLTAGAQAGYNWQFHPNWLVGLEGDIGYLGIKRDFVDWNDVVAVGIKTNWYATLRGRVGYVTGPSVLYVTGGAAFVGVKDTFGGNPIAGLTPTSHSDTLTGWTVGGGIETMLNRRWSAKAEYLYIDAGDTSFVSNPFGLTQTAAFDHRYHVIKSGLNYRFGGPDDGSLLNASLIGPARDWSGFYVGGHIGLGISATQIERFNGFLQNTDMNGAGFAGGVQAGYNWHLTPQWVVGVEGDIGYLGLDHTYDQWNEGFPGIERSFALKTGAYGTIRGRVGYSTGASLLYATGGAAFVRLDESLTLDALPQTQTVTKTASGWTFGGGIETALNSQWSAKLEYLYIDVANVDTQITLWSGQFDNKFQVVRAGLNYKFGGPVAAKY